MKYIIRSLVFIICSSLIFAFFNRKKINLDDKSKSIYDYTIELINGDTISMESYRGKKIIIVNVASKCGYTPQYKGLQELYDRHNEKIEIIGFPANDFLRQEPAKNEEIKVFCSSNYGVTFPLVQKTVVKKNENQHPLFTWLSHSELNGWNDSAPSWNFCKYLIDDNGRLVKFYPSKIIPMDEKIIEFVDN